MDQGEPREEMLDVDNEAAENGEIIGTPIRIPECGNGVNVEHYIHWMKEAATALSKVTAPSVTLIGMHNSVELNVNPETDLIKLGKYWKENLKFPE